MKFLFSLALYVALFVPLRRLALKIISRRSVK